MERAKPPFRADQVGSLIRSPALIAARRAFMANKMSRDALRTVEDGAIRDVVRLQEEVGLHSITDGEFRRLSYLHEFLEPLGVEFVPHGSKDLQFYDAAGNTAPGTLAVIKRRLKWNGSVNADAFRFLRSVSNETPKITLPAPTQVHLFAGHQGISKEAYPDLDDFWDDLIAAYHAELNALGEVGCTYVQLDETAMPKIADPKVQDVLKARGQDWRAMLETYASVINRIIAQAPRGMTIALHHCRGNWGQWFQAQASYDAVADVMFGSVKATAFFVEYDTPRADDFSALRFLPRDRFAVLGLVSTKVSRLETKDELRRRIDDAARVVPLEQLCLSPQCGFSTGFEHPNISNDDQRRKMERVVEVARDVWGSA